MEQHNPLLLTQFTRKKFTKCFWTAEWIAFPKNTARYCITQHGSRWNWVAVLLSHLCQMTAKGTAVDSHSQQEAASTILQVTSQAVHQLLRHCANEYGEPWFYRQWVPFGKHHHNDKMPAWTVAWTIAIVIWFNSFHVFPLFRCHSTSSQSQSSLKIVECRASSVQHLERGITKIESLVPSKPK
jgi:hypothetical protein